MAENLLGGCGVCEFCHKHGEGEKWYLSAKNYSLDLISDVRRRRFVVDLMSHPELARPRLRPRSARACIVTRMAIPSRALAAMRRSTGRRV